VREESDNISGGVGTSNVEHNSNADVGSDGSEAEAIVIRDMSDILKIDIENFCLSDLRRYEFVTLDVAYMFYCWFARTTGFSVRKGQVVRNGNGQIIQQTFSSSCQGFREDRGLTKENRKREPRNETRCGCKAKCRVHLDILSGRWYVSLLNLDHNNHDLLGGTLCGLLPAYRKLSQLDIDEIERNRKAGIRPFQVYGTMANECGGFHKVGFVKKDLYNQIGRQRKQMYSDARNAVKYLRDLKTKDPLMFVTHSIDKEKRLERLFWCDGESRMNYEIFGDVLAFDATYQKNKYNCPFVVFSGVNHHNQTIVFATAIVTRETEETYVWLLEQLLTAMKGKHPLSVITDGDTAMKNAIKRTFPNAHHRLCA
jgi:hypothetical protein